MKERSGTVPHGNRVKPAEKKASAIMDRGSTRLPLREALRRAEWRASTYVAPHEYVLKWKYPALYAAMILLIKREGYSRRFQGAIYRSADLNGYTYWIIPPVLNRVRMKGRKAAQCSGARD